MKTSKLIQLWLFTVVGLSLLSGCRGQAQVAPERDSEGAQTAVDGAPSTASTLAGVEPGEQVDTILVLMADEVTTLDPYRMVSLHPEGSIASHIWDALTWLNDELQVEPRLAESWQVIDELTWEFTLRRGVAFHNGEVFNAESVRFSLERAQSMPGSLETIAADIDLKQVEIIDDYTVRLVTGRPVANLPYYLAGIEMLPPLYYSEASPEMAARAPVGSGPYRWLEGQPGETIVLEAAPGYWQGTPAVFWLIFQTMPSVGGRLAVLAASQSTLVTDLPPDVVAAWDEGRGRLAMVESTQRMLIGIRAEEGSPLRDRRVRRALNYGLNVDKIAADFLEGYGQRYGSWVNPPWNHPDLPPWKYDPDLARLRLTEAGYTEGFQTTLSVPAGVYPQGEAIAEAIAAQWSKIGLEVKVEVLDWGNYAHRLISGETSTLFLLSMNSRGDGLEDTRNLSADFPFNPTGWYNQTFEDTVRQAAQTFDETKRLTLLQEAQAIAYEEAPWVWLWRPYLFYGLSHNLDWAPRPDGLVYLYRPQ